ncbi:hypothetical protein CHISP_3690 [Chitinispirillum alkaliphilum]|nr:hypothetical protein CHISP_3690 [Chitinispirillum alkaliphilum]
MALEEVKPLQDFTLWVRTSGGCSGYFDVKPYLDADAFLPLKQWSEFVQFSNRGYFIEWPCGADLSADTIESKMAVTSQQEKKGLSVREDEE